MRRHHDRLQQGDVQRLFWEAPESTDFRDRSSVAYALGATLYMPATLPQLAAARARALSAGGTSIVICLEDSVADRDVAFGLDQVRLLLAQDQEQEPPALFVRVRDADQIAEIADFDSEQVLTGFVIPKFDPDESVDAMEAVAEARSGRSEPLYVMPVLETPSLADPRTRAPVLERVVGLLSKFPDMTLAVRIGATDIAGTLGLRRVPELTCYDIGVVRDAITDIRSVVGGDRDLAPVIAGCAWEFISARDHRDAAQSFLGLEALIREIVLDKVNGLCGKTVIHPLHISVVNALHTVTHEEFSDAAIVLGDPTGGVSRSEYRNKMNEHRPHRSWAVAILARARAYGVLAPGVVWGDLLACLWERETPRDC